MITLSISEGKGGLDFGDADNETIELALDALRLTLQHHIRANVPFRIVVVGKAIKTPAPSRGDKALEKMGL